MPTSWRTSPIFRRSAAPPRMRSTCGSADTGPRHKGMTSGAGPTGRGSGGQLLRGVGNLGSAVGAAVAGTRPLESFEFGPLMTFGAILLVVAAVAFWKPSIVIWPIGLLLAALGLQLVARGIQARLAHRRPRTQGDVRRIVPPESK